MSDLIWLSEAQMRRMKPYFRLSDGFCRSRTGVWSKGSSS